MKSEQERALALLESRLGGRNRGYRWFLLPLLLSSERELASILSIPGPEARTFSDALRSEFKRTLDIVSPGELAALGHRPPRSRVPTGVPCIDDLLGGGFLPGQTYQLFGPPGSGKTELAYLAILSFLHHPFGKETKVAVIDSEHSFRPERLVQHAGAPVDLNRVFVATCYSSPHLVTLLGTVTSMMRRGASIPLLVVDSVMPPSFQLDQEEAAGRQRLLLDLSERIWAISRDQGACVLFTNHSAGSLPLPSNSNVFLGCSDHAVHTRRDELDPAVHVARSMKSAASKEREVRFRVGPGGITA
ncbi:MAG: hypothetical protein JW839_15380 [Candidatus Lokiarchaeota archaeon]|nr:hypothetical protein [Candidatus Lokiarchaeota archaeon]